MNGLPRMTARRTAGAVLAVLVGYAVWLSLEASSAADPGDVGQITLAEICERVRAGVPLVFVDVREPEEFAEEHLPGALHMPLREMRDRAAEELASSDVVVPYCLKDFRGFEGGRRLRELGFADVRLMEKIGINGWKAAGFPTAGELPGASDEEGLGELALLCESEL